MRSAAPPFTVADLAAELRWPDGVELGLVEGVGGPRSPIAADGDTVDLRGHIRPDVVVLVADAGLGTINAVRLSADALRGLRPRRRRSTATTTATTCTAATGPGSPSATASRSWPRRRS